MFQKLTSGLSRWTAKYGSCQTIRCSPAVGRVQIQSLRVYQGWSSVYILVSICIVCLKDMSTFMECCVLLACLLRKLSKCSCSCGISRRTPNQKASQPLPPAPLPQSQPVPIAMPLSSASHSFYETRSRPSTVDCMLLPIQKVIWPDWIE